MSILFSQALLCLQALFFWTTPFGFPQTLFGHDLFAAMLKHTDIFGRWSVHGEFLLFYRFVDGHQSTAPQMKKSGRCYLRSVRSIPAHTPLISIPRSLCIECSTGPTFQGSFSATAVLANRLSRYLHDPRSLYRRYAEFLHDIHNMEGDDAGLAAEDPRTVVLQQQLDDFYAGNVLHAKGVANAPFLPKESISTPRLRRDWGKIHCIVREVRQAVPHFAAPSVPWAVSMVLARSRLLHDGQTAMLSMMPMIDLAEHSYQPNSILHCTANSRDSKNCGVRWHDDSVPCLHLVSTRDIGKGEPISVSYTPRPAVTLEDQEYWQLTWGFFRVRVNTMQVPVLEVVSDASLRHSFVLVSKRFFETSLAPFLPGRPPQMVPLRLQGPHGTVFVGCLVGKYHNHSGQKILFPGLMAMNLGLKDGDIVQCVPSPKLPVATRVMVSPISVDESEVVEKNAVQIQMQLLQQLQVVAPGMPVTVFLFSGMTARMKVSEIECGEGNPMCDGAAMMTDGTLFIVATRQRVAEQPPEEEQVKPPTWAFLRSLPYTVSSSPVVEVNPISARVWSWRDGMDVEVLNVAHLSRLKEPTLSASFLREHQIKAKLRFSEEVPIGSCHSVIRSITNVLITPGEGSARRENVDGESDTDDADDFPSWEEVCAVHGSLPVNLLHHINFSLDSTGQVTNRNVLVCGGKGYGKSAVVSVVLRQLKDVHVVKVKCFLGKDFIEKLRECVMEAVLCAPSVLLLDDFDVIAPAQKEGNNAAMTDTTKAILYAVVHHLSTMAGLMDKNPVLVVATALSRDTLNEHFRSAALFPSSWTINALTRLTRQTLLSQCISPLAPEELRKMASFLDNYTPFDIRRVALRILSSGNQQETIVDRTRRVVASFTPLAHSGISFLKGEKVEWTEIGGLKEAKKVLYDTLVLPIQHPQLFSRLPLKTRSGILLYGASGCGKTFILESLVKAENLNCLVVNGPEVFGKYIGQSEQKIRDVFERAQAAAPCVVFFDEFDSVAPQRGLDNSGVTDRVVNQLLCYLDGVEGRKDVFVVAASSRPDLIDAALLRPGRLDKAVACPIPSLEDRREILRNLLSKIQSTVTEEDIFRIAERTQDWTPADLAALVSTANTTASQKVLASLPSPSMSVVDASTEDYYCIMQMSGSQSIDKVKDSLKFLETTKAKAQEIQAIEVTPELMMDALHKTRPTLTPADIKKFNRIHDLFSRGQTSVPKNPGTKLTSI
eukprot:gene4365-3175_t